MVSFQAEKNTYDDRVIQFYEYDPNEISNMIKWMKETKRITNYSDVVILFNSIRNSVIEGITSSLRKKGIEYCIYESESILDIKEVKTIIGFCCKLLQIKLDLDTQSIKNLPLGCEFQFYLISCIQSIENVMNENSNILELLDNASKTIIENNNEAVGIDFRESIMQLLQSEPFISDKNNISMKLSLLLQQIDSFQEYYAIEKITFENIATIGSFFYYFLSNLLYKGLFDHENQNIIVASDRVHIMTKHKSKGLEFPVVISVNYREKSRTRFNGFSESQQELFRDLSKLERQDIQFSNNCVDYVSYSRAQDLLVVIDEFNLNSSSISINSWMNYFKDFKVSNIFHASQFNDRPVSKPVFSYSVIKKLVTCKNPYHYYIVEGFNKSKSVANTKGLLIHSTIARINEAVMNGLNNFGNKDLVQIFENNYDTLIKSGEKNISEDDKRNCFEQCETYFMKTYEFKFKVQSIEERITVEEPFYILEGRMDLLLERDRGMELWDIKSDANMSMIDEYYEQLCFYAYILWKKGIIISKMCIYWSNITNIDINVPVTEFLVSNLDYEDIGMNIGKIIEDNSIYSLK